MKETRIKKAAVSESTEVRRAVARAHVVVAEVGSETAVVWGQEFLAASNETTGELTLDYLFIALRERDDLANLRAFVVAIKIRCELPRLRISIADIREQKGGIPVLRGRCKVARN